MLIEQRAETIDACRFCFMCRHVCTLSVVTGWESDTPRGKALVLFKILKEHTKYSPDLVDAVYRCCLCGMCRSWCRGGYDMPHTIELARRDIVALGMEPEAARSIRSHILETGNPFGFSTADRFKAIETDSARPNQAEVLYYVGCDVAYHQPEIANAFIRILTLAGVDFTFLTDEITSGKPLAVLGYAAEAKRIAEVLSERIRSTRCRTLVTTCPASYDAFVKDYAGLLGKIDVVHATEYISRLLSARQVNPRRTVPRLATVQDSDYLCRYHGLDDVLRSVVGRIPGLEIKEMAWSRQIAHSCGEAAGVFRVLYPQISGELAVRALAEAHQTGASLLVTACPHTKRTLSAANQSGLEIRDVVELIAESL